MFIKTLFLFSFIFTIALADETKLLKRGEKLYDIMCDKKAIETIRYNTPNELKLQIKDKNYCSNIDNKKLYAVVIYLTKREPKTKILQKVNPPKDAKCPVCGMFVVKFPKWITSLQIEDKTYYFDGVKDMLKYYLDKHKKIDIAQIIVNDYYTLEPIDAKTAWYVTGSTVYGPMGDEFIAFKTQKDAKSFSYEHHGKKIVKFSDIDEKLVYDLD